MAKILFVDLRKSYDKFSIAYEQAIKNGHNIYCLFDLPKYLDYKNTTYVNPTREEFIAAANIIIETYNIDYVLSQTDLLAPVLDELEGAMVLPQLTVPRATILNKIAFTRLLTEHGFNQPKYWVPKSFDELRVIEGPIFIKPSNGTGGLYSRTGIISPNTFAEFDYQRFDSVNDLPQEKFIQIQNVGGKFPNGKHVAGLDGRYIIQECVTARRESVFNIVVENDNIHYRKVTLYEPAGDKLFDLSDHQEVLNSKKANIFFDQKHDIGLIKEMWGDKFYSFFNKELKRLIKTIGLTLGELDGSIITRDMNNFEETSYFNDFHFRMSGVMCKAQARGELKGNYTTIFEYLK